MNIKFLLIIFTLIISFVWSESTQNEIVNECQTIKEFMSAFSLYNEKKSTLECNENGELIKLFCSSEVTISQMFIDEIGKYRNLTSITIEAHFEKQIYNFDAIEHLSSLKSLAIENTSENRGELRDEFFPTGICKATNLEFIELVGFNFKSFPKKISNLKKLKLLDLSHNEINILPNRIGDLESLENLGLFDNQITSIPSRIGDLKNLITLYLNDNKISSTPKRLGDLKNLQILNLSNNTLTTYPRAIGNLENLEHLDLSNNPIEEDIPESYNNLKKLETFIHPDECQKIEKFLKSVDITGYENECNDEGKLTSLYIMELRPSKVLQKFIDEIGKYRYLEYLDILAYFKEEVYNFDAIGKLSSLVSLSVKNSIVYDEENSQAQLRDEYFPTGICKATNLEQIEFIGFNFKSFPKRISDLKKLKQLNLIYNNINILPNRIGDLESLEILDLMSNQITSIPSRIGDLKNLKRLLLEDNKVNSIPKRIGDLINLESLVLTNNQVSIIPKRMGDLKNLEELILDNNNITSYPEVIGNLENLEYLYLNDNPIEGDIPESYNNLKKLKIFNHP